MESWYITLSMTSDFKYCNGSVVTRKFHNVEKGWRLNGQTAVLLMNADFGPKTIKIFRSANKGSLNLYRKQSTKLEIVAKFQNT